MSTSKSSHGLESNCISPNRPLDRRTFLHGAAAGAAMLAVPRWAYAEERNLNPVWQQIEKRHDESVQRLQQWIRQPSIAAENKGVNEGCELTMQFLRDAGFGEVTKIPTDGQPGIFATLDAGAPRTLGLYFMYDVKQVDPSEWSSPPWDAALVEKPGLGKVIVGRGAVNQKGPEAAFLAALHAVRGAGSKLPVNLVLVAEGEEEIGSPHFPQIVRRPEVLAALQRCSGIFMPSAVQGMDGVVTLSLGAKGVIELELTSSGELWGRGPRQDVHSSNKARLDSPAWHLVKALNTLITKEGDLPAIEGFADQDLRHPKILLHHLDGPAPGHVREYVAAGVDRGDRGVARHAHAQCLDHARHGGGGAHSHAVARRARHAGFRIHEIRERHLAGADVLAERPHVCAGADVLAAEFPIQHGSTGDADRWQIATRRTRKPGVSVRVV